MTHPIRWTRKNRVCKSETVGKMKNPKFHHIKGERVVERRIETVKKKFRNHCDC